MITRQMDDLEALDARLGALGAAGRAADAARGGFGTRAAPMDFDVPSPPMSAPALTAPPPQEPRRMLQPQPQLQPQQQQQLQPQPQVPPAAPPATSDLPRGFIGDLRSWSSKFRFTPEMEYIKVSRTGPAMYKNVNATGWLCDVYQSFDEQYIGSVWGGGTYVIVAYQNMGGGPREVERGYTQINGNPRAYRGPDGQPIPFPADTNDNRSSLPGVASPPQFQPQQQQQQFAQQSQQPQFQPQPGMGVQFPTMNNSLPPQTTAPVLDLITLAEKFNGNKQDAKSLEVLQASQQQNTEFFKSTLDRSLDEQRQLREQMAAMQQHQTAPMQNAIEMYRSQMETRERAHAETMKQITSEHLAQLNALRAQQEAQVTGLRLQSEKASEEMRRSADKAIDDQRRSFETMIQNMREEGRAREQSVRDAWRVEVENLRRELDNQRLATTAEVTRTRDDARRDLDTARAETDRREQSARDMARTTYEGQIRSLEMQVATVREQLERRIEDLNNMRNQQDAIQKNATVMQMQQRDQQESILKNSYEMQLQQRDTEITRLRDELNSLRTETATLRADLGEKRDPMTTLNEVATLTQTFQSITGQNNNQPKESEPVGWMAQLAKYAPSIGEHLIKPTMKPIAEVVQTVREREEREELLRRDILMRRQALAQRGAQQQQQQVMVQQQQAQQAHQQAVAQQQAMTQAQQHATMQRQRQQQQQHIARVRAHMPQAPALGVVLPQASQAPQVSQPAAPVEAPAPATTGMESLLTKELVEYMEGAVSSGMPAADLLGQLKSAVDFGMVDASVLEQVKSMPADTLVDVFTQAAGQYGSMQLASPRGEEFLRSVHAAMNA